MPMHRLLAAGLASQIPYLQRGRYLCLPHLRGQAAPIIKFLTCSRGGLASRDMHTFALMPTP
jgi:hypothetical protein